MDYLSGFSDAILGFVVTAAGVLIFQGRMQQKVDNANKTAERAIEEGKEIRRELSEHKVYAAREFIDRNELDGVAKQFMSAVAGLRDSVESGFQHIANRIDAMVLERRPSSE